MPKRNKSGADIYGAARNRVLNLTPAEAGVEQSPDLPRVWGVVMDVPQPAVTLVALADGTTSLYFGNGGAVVGAGEHAPVAKARDSLIALVQQFDSKLEPTTDFPLPPVGSVRFYLLTFTGVRTAEVSGLQHELMPLSEHADEVITAIRMCTEAQQKASRRRSKDNVRFVAITAACLALGAAVGAVAVEERLPGALGGGVVGMVAGFIVAGIEQIVSRAVRSMSA
jgi:hypothetical protein